MKRNLIAALAAAAIACSGGGDNAGGAGGQLDTVPSPLAGTWSYAIAGVCSDGTLAFKSIEVYDPDPEPILFGGTWSCSGVGGAVSGWTSANGTIEIALVPDAGLPTYVNGSWTAASISGQARLPPGAVAAFSAARR